MKIIRSYHNDWRDDPDLGEYLIGQSMIKNNHLLSDDYTYIYIALSPLINERGTYGTQPIIDDICKNNDGKLIFVCQHIYVKEINWHNNIVFSTHATFNDKVKHIPHYSATYDESKIKKERDILFSFIGHTGTHKVREELVKLYPDKCFSTEGKWMSEKYRDKYIDLLGRSKFSLCPRGTGTGSLRLYESMRMGSIPIIISDVQKFSFNFPQFIRLEESNIYKIEEELSKPRYTEEWIDRRSKQVQEYWEEYCSDDNLYKTIIKTLKDD